MTNNLQRQDDRDLREKIINFYTVLLDSKRLIIFITIFFTILGSIYIFQKEDTYKSSMIILVGNYDSRTSKEDDQIQTTGTLIRDLIIKFIYRDSIIDATFKNNSISSSNLSIGSLQSRLLSVEYTSPSKSTNEMLLLDISKYIEDSHSKILTNKIEAQSNKLTHEIDKLTKFVEYEEISETNRVENYTSQIKQINKYLLSLEEAKKIEINSNISNLKTQIENYTSQIKQINKYLLSLEEAKKIEINSNISNLKTQISSNNDKVNALLELIAQTKRDIDLLKSNQQSILEKTPSDPAIISIVSELTILNKNEFNYRSDLIDYKEKVSKLESQIKFLEVAKNISEPKSQLFEVTEADIIIYKEREKINVLSQKKDDSVSSDLIFSNKQKIDTLNFQLALLQNREPTKTKIVGEIETSDVDKKIALTIFLSFIFGLLFSALIVFIMNFFKSFNIKNNS